MNWAGFKAKLSSFGKKVSSSVKKYKTHLTISGVAIVALFGILLLLPGGHISTSGDFICGAECNSTINYTNSQYDIKACNITDLGINIYFDKAIKDYQIYLKLQGDWVQNFTGCIEKKKNEIWEFKLVGHKNPYDTVKWSVKIGDSFIDPTWFGGKLTINKTDVQYDATHFLILFNLTSTVNYTIDDPDVIHMVKDKVKGNSDINYFEFRIKTDINYYNQTRTYICLNSFNYTLNPRYFWCFHNETRTNNITSWNVTVIDFEHGFETGNIGLKTAKWNETITSGGDYVKFNPLGKTIQSNRIYELAFYAEKNIELGESDIHFDFFFADNNMNMTWWNTTCATRQQILAPISSPLAITYINGSSGVYGSGNIVSWENNTGPAYVYNCTYGSTPYYPVANGAQLNWENGTLKTGNNWTGGYNESGLLRFFKFDDSVLWKNDSTQWGKNLSAINQVTFNTSDCLYGTCADFQGSDDVLINISNAEDLRFTQATSFTLHACAKQDSTGAYRNLIRMDPSFDTGRTLLILRIENNDYPAFYVGAIATFDTATSNITVTQTNRYFCLDGVFDASISRMMLYVNGSLVANVSQSGAFTLASTCLILGGDRGCVNAFNEEWDGRMDDIRIYNRPLSPVEVSELYANSVTLGVVETQSASGPDINLTFGPASTTSFMWEGCSPDWENATSQPINQTPTYGIDQICNNGTATGNVSINLTGTLTNNWTIWASNTSVSAGLLNLTSGVAQRIYTGLTQGSCTYVWFKANCSYANIGPNVYESYWMSA